MSITEMITDPEYLSFEISENEMFDGIFFIMNNPTKDLHSATAGYFSPPIGEHIEELKAILSFFNKERIKALPLFYRKQFLNSVNPILGSIKSIRAYVLNRQNPNADAQQSQHYSQFFASPQNHFQKEKKRIQDLITLSLANQSTKQIDNNSILKKFEIDSTNSLNGLTTKTNELNGLIESYKQEIAKSVVSNHSVIFSTQAETHKRNSFVALGAVFLLLFSIWVVLVCSHKAIQNFNNAHVLQINNVKVFPPFIDKLEIYSIAALAIILLSYLLTLAVKNYFAEKHNQTVNEQKANSLSTFNTFAAITDAEAKKAILLQVTTTIFSHRSPGFLGKNGETDGSLPLIELVKIFKGTSN